MAESSLLARQLLTGLTLAILLASCGSSESPEPNAAGQTQEATAPSDTPETSSTTIPPSTTASTTTSTVALTPSTTAAPTTTERRGVVDEDGRRRVMAPLGTLFAVADGIELFTPSRDIEVIGFHEANHDGTREIEARTGVVPSLVLESRERGTNSRSAADVVVNPDLPIYAPVTGRVLRAGGYVLYCDNRDSFVVIEPEGRPGIEVKILHILDNEVNAGDQVIAGETRIAPGSTPLPFNSQVDEFTGEPSWPHVHIEVVDTSIPDRPNPGSGSSDC